MEVDILNLKAEDLTVEKIDELIRLKRSFIVVGVKDISYIVNKIEASIETKKLSCRVYSEMRTAAIAAVAIPTPFTILGGLAAAAGTAIHNVATYNPDYEIGKNYLKSTVKVMYQRDN